MPDLSRIIVVTALLAVVPTAVASAQASETTAPRQYYELRTYHFDTAVQQQRYEGYLRDALIPALNRAGLTPIGAFTVEKQPDNHTLYLFIPYPSIEAFATLDDKLAADTALHAAGSAIWNLPATDPPYSRIESSLLYAFPGMPQLHIPAETAGNKGRAFELRTYSSASERAGLKKIEMFDVGEIAVFKRAGFQPVFYGQTIIGSNRPSLTYMITYPDGVDRGSLWKKFGADPESKRLFAKPEYQDKQIVSKIDHVFLRPTSCSQL
ncbi:MAG TPA: NIPSNAP family protein [Armatimonadota bacterium]|nr:NIPSNAP family protein [Armatimonadota bacterium]